MYSKYKTAPANVKERIAVIFDELRFNKQCSLSIEAVDDCVERRNRFVVSFETSQIFDFSYHSMVVGIDVILKDIHFQ